MHKTKRILYGFYLGLILLVSGCSSQGPSYKFIQGFFLTSPEIRSLQGSTSELRISEEELLRWDQSALELLQASPLTRGGDYQRLFAYLYSAQKAFADASFEISNEYAGSLDPISFHILKLFYPNYEAENMKSDPYTKKVTQILTKKIDQRFLEEERKIHAVSLQKGESLWHGNSPQGIAAPTMKPWSLKNAREFRSPKPPPPDDKFWEKQLQEVKSETENVDDWKRQRSLVWQGKVNPGEGDWRNIGVTYMEKNKIPLQMQLEVRRKLAIGLLDAYIAVYDTKYAYLVRRPVALDSKIPTVFSTPNHPSYPSAHSATSSAAVTILSYYFPENNQEWDRLAKEASQSRMWAGIHFPIDLKAGKKQGISVGKAVIFR